MKIFTKTPSTRLTKYKNKHRENVSFILGTGPSINALDLSPLQKEVVYTVNGATLLQEKFGLTPTFFCTSDQRFLNSEKADLATSRVHPNTVRLVRDVIRSQDDVNEAHRTIYVNTIGKNGFSSRIDKGFYFWCTSVSLAIQMAWYTGSPKVALLGVDLNYAMAQPRFYHEENPQPVDNFVGVQIHNIAKAAREFEAAGRELVVCSEKSMLRPYLKYEAYEDIVKS